MKQQTHLTPEEIIELQKMGVEFRETVDIWVKIGKQWDRRSREFQSELDDVRPDIEAGLGFELPKSEVLPAPNLQEVLVVLDEVYRTKGSQWMWSINPLHSKYVCSVGMISASNCIRGVGDTPLIAVINALRQLCKNHPETLTKTE